MQTYKDIKVSLKLHTALIKINRPPHNYFDSNVINQIANFLEEMDKNKECRSIILYSEGKNFCAGANFNEITYSRGGNIYSELYEQALRLFKTKKPIIAIIQGAAIGGGLGLALAADFRIACKESRFSANFGKLGFHQGFGITVTLPRTIGKQKAKWMLLTSNRVKGEKALEIGLADYFVKKNDLMAKAISLSNIINSSGPLGIESIRNTLNIGLVKILSETMKNEALEQNKLKETNDFNEGIKASLERREPKFKRN